MFKKDLISIKDLTVTEIEELFVLADKIKRKREDFSFVLKGKSLGLVFQKPSNRTRVSFEVGMFQLGGQSIYLGPEDIKLGIREAIKDIAKVLSRYLNGIVARTFLHRDVLELAKYATIPVINGLSDLLHPCQALSDVYTIREKLGSLKKATVAYVGDGNNVLHSLLHCCSKLGINLKIATPEGYEPDRDILKEAEGFSKESKARISLFYNPAMAVKNSDIVYTDVWTSMGQEKEYKKRLRDFKAFQVNSRLLSNAKKDCLVMHCLPAHRGEEITDEVIDSCHSIIFDQAENRLYLEKAILIKLLKGEE